MPVLSSGYFKSNEYFRSLAKIVSEIFVRLRAAVSRRPVISSIVILILSACDAHYDAPPTSFTFDNAQAGHYTCKQFSVSRIRVYQFILDVRYNNKDERRRVMDMLGVMSDGNVIIPIAIILNNIKSGEVFSMEKYSSKHDNHASDITTVGSVSRLIASKKLDDGDYRICAAVISDIKELSSFSMGMTIGWYWNASP